MLKHKPSDYSGLARYMGSSYVDLLGKWVFPVHFNHVEIGDARVKYGVVEEKVFMQDLCGWDRLTFAGRLHKPVYMNILGQ